MKNNIADLKEKYFFCIDLFAASLYLKKKKHGKEEELVKVQKVDGQ